MDISKAIFLSHSSRDDAFVAKLREALETQKLRTWVDSRELRGGEELTERVREEIENARAFIVVISPDAFNSAWVAEETRYAAQVRAQHKQGYPVIPLLREGVELGALKWLFIKDARAIRVKEGPMGIRKAVPQILAALGETPVSSDKDSEIKGEKRMIEIAIPGYRKLQIEHIVMDYNGTLACDGKLIAGVRPCLDILADRVDIHILTADTFGKAKAQIENLPGVLSILSAENQDIGKFEYVKKLGCEHTVCIGNGRNDRLMLKEAALGIAVILEEGAAVESVMAADVVCTNIVSALELLIHPLRLTATLRS